MINETYMWVGTLDPLTLFLLGILSLLINFIPSIVAFSREHPDRVLILVLNFFFGWTGIGWVILFIWSLRNTTVLPPPPRQRHNPR